MKQNNPIAGGLSSHLFWDVNKETLDWDKHLRLIVERVIQRGTYKNLLLIEKVYGKEKISDVIKHLPFLTTKDMMFVHRYYNIALEDLKCYKMRRSFGPIGIAFNI